MASSVGWLVLLVGVVTSFGVCAGQVHSDKIRQFELKPQVCIVKKIGDECELLTTVEIAATEVMTMCLVQQKTILKCWQDKQIVAEKLAILLAASTEVELLDQAQNVLATEQLQVNAVNPKRRKRLRPAWSLF